jgi:hypothetical protein
MPAAIISWYCTTESWQTGSGGIALGKNCPMEDETDMTQPSVRQGQSLSLNCSDATPAASTGHG